MTVASDRIEDRTIGFPRKTIAIRFSLQLQRPGITVEPPSNSSAGGGVGAPGSDREDRGNKVRLQRLRIIDKSKVFQVFYMQENLAYI